MNDNVPADMQEVLRPIASLLSKSEKAQAKVAPGTWQHTMLDDNITALRIAQSLMTADSSDEHDFSSEDLRGALDAISSMIDRTEKSQARFEPGTSQHTLQRNRLKALRSAQESVRARLGRT